MAAEPNLNLNPISAYPNPFSSYLTIKAEGASSIRIFALDGSLVRLGQVVEGKFSWDGSDAKGHDVDPGIYFIKIYTSSELFSGKLLIFLGVQYSSKFVTK